MQLGEWRDDFEALGVAVATMSYDGVDVLAEFTSDNDIGYPMLSDAATDAVAAGERARVLGILNEEYQPGHPAYDIAHPGIFYVDAEGIIRGKWAERGYQTRPSFAQVLADVKALISEGAAAP